jgi:hypothetical protein
MRNRILLIALCLACGLAQAQTRAQTQAPAPAAAASAPKPNPPRWPHAIHVHVIIGADVASAMDGQFASTSVILRIPELSQLPSVPLGAAECVFDAAAWSNLASERVTVRPHTLRCFDAQGREFPSRTVTGFAVDKDSLFGIKSPQLWSPAAKELLYMGAGAQAKQSFVTRRLSSALGVASMGLSDEFLTNDEPKQATATPDSVREVRSMDALLPTLTLEPGREFEIVLQGTHR